MHKPMYLKVHRAPGMSDVVAVCDRELINTTISHDKLSVKITEAFYGTSTASESEVREALKRACNANLMGERAITTAIDMGLVTREGCIMIGKVPHVQIYEL
jgi:uncharacterized protein